jgi:hypothetical protein
VLHRLEEADGAKHDGQRHQALQQSRRGRRRHLEGRRGQVGQPHGGHDQRGQRQADSGRQQERLDQRDGKQKENGQQAQQQRSRGAPVLFEEVKGVVLCRLPFCCCVMCCWFGLLRATPAPATAATTAAPAA